MFCIDGLDALAWPKFHPIAPPFSTIIIYGSGVHWEIPSMEPGLDEVWHCAHLCVSLTVGEDRMRFGIAKLETVFPFVSALTFRYL